MAALVSSAVSAPSQLGSVPPGEPVDPSAGESNLNGSTALSISSAFSSALAETSCSQGGSAGSLVLPVGCAGAGASSFVAPSQLGGVPAGSFGSANRSSSAGGLAAAAPGSSA
jgi:hypothetical protein